MKFMQRREEKKNRIRLEKEQNKALKDTQWVVNSVKPGILKTSIIIDDGLKSEGTMFKAGRRSYGNFNPLIQKLVKDIHTEVSTEQEEQEGTVTDNDMAATAIRNKTLKQPQESNKKRKKPSSSVREEAAQFLKKIDTNGKVGFKKPSNLPV